jgi:hypothetical protein
MRGWIEWRTHEAKRGAVSVGTQRWRSALVAAIAVMATMGCGDGQQTDPRNLTYCGGRCWGATICCASSNAQCPEYMPLHGSPCAPTGLNCGYGCDRPYAGHWYEAACFSTGWHVGETHCDPPSSLDAGPTPDAMVDTDAASDAAPSDGS